ncbi:hypothetical protein ONZ45_g10168 [Pleurotus djamor]|nr:hypothetical protein ONZ45_g10168 [Pleurotus djamor]
MTTIPTQPKVIVSARPTELELPPLNVVDIDSASRPAHVLDGHQLMHPAPMWNKGPEHRDTFRKQEHQFLCGSPFPWPVDIDTAPQPTSQRARLRVRFYPTIFTIPVFRDQAQMPPLNQSDVAILSSICLGFSQLAWNRRVYCNIAAWAWLNGNEETRAIIELAIAKMIWRERCRAGMPRPSPNFLKEISDLHYWMVRNAHQCARSRPMAISGVDDIQATILARAPEYHPRSGS